MFSGKIPVTCTVTSETSTQSAIGRDVNLQTAAVHYTQYDSPWSSNHGSTQGSPSGLDSAPPLQLGVLGKVPFGCNCSC